jgi:ankyrin repeat protein
LKFQLLLALIVAAKQGDLQLLRRQIEEEGVNIDETDPDGNSALHWAVLNKSKKHFAMAQYLMDAGASVNLGNEKDSQTPLHWACTTGNTQAVTLLLHHDADPNQVDKRGCNALLFACQYNHPLLVYYLVKQGMDLDGEDYAGHTALHWAAYFGYNPLIRMLIKLGAHINKRDDQG